MHLCGTITKKLYDELLELEFPVLSFGFSGQAESKNLEVVSRESLEENNKKLGVGFILNTELEDLQVTGKRLKNIVEKVGMENIAYLHPDCGFGSTKPELIEPILKNMVSILGKKYLYLFKPKNIF
jgi:methionine synthase II (cobalamin-independent)